METPLIWTIHPSDHSFKNSSKLYHDDAMKKYTQAMTQATPQATPQASSQQKQPHKHVTMKHTTMKHKDPAPYMYDTLQLSFLTTHYENPQDYNDEFPLYKIPQYITPVSYTHLTLPTTAIV